MQCPINLYCACVRACVCVVNASDKVYVQISLLHVFLPVYHALFYSVTVVNTDDPPAPLLFDLYLNENPGQVGINFTTIDSSDPMDNYTK